MEPVLVPEVLDVLSSEEVWSEEVSSCTRTPLRGSRALKWNAGKALMKDRRLRDRITQTIRGLEDANGTEQS